MVALQWILAIAFIIAGIAKLTLGKDKGVERMAWMEDFSDPTVRGIGLAELAGGLALGAPLVSDTLPNVALLAAVCLAVTMALAVFVHLRRRDPVQDMVSSVVLGVLLLILIVGGLV